MSGAWDFGGSLEMNEQDKNETLGEISKNIKASALAIGAMVAGIIVAGTAVLGNWIINKLLVFFGG